MDGIQEVLIEAGVPHQAAIEMEATGNLETRIQEVVFSPLEERELYAADVVSSQGKIYGLEIPNKRGIFTIREDELSLKVGDLVILKTHRGRESATVRYVDLNQELNRGKELAIQKILRLANDQDLKILEQNADKEKRALSVINKKIESLKLKMRVVRTECLFDGSRIVFYFLAPHKVDFRELVKMLSSELRSRIELRQISTREYVGLVGAVGACGRPTCCSTFLTKSPVVSLGMVENQRLIKNPTKLNGICGRLKCCLTYENNFYKEALDGVPSRSACVGCANGKKAVVCGANVFTGKLTLRSDEDFSFYEIPFSEARELKILEKSSRCHREEFSSDEEFSEELE